METGTETGGEGFKKGAEKRGGQPEGKGGKGGRKGAKGQERQSGLEGKGRRNVV